MKTCVKSLVTGSLLTLAAFSAAAQPDPRTTALAAWYFGDGIAGETNPITSTGTIRYNVVPTGYGARPANRTAQLTSAYFNAGTNLGVSGNQLTVFLRARVPGGSWSSGLFAKRGSTNVLNYNLFGGTSGTNIGFEVRTANGFVSLGFPVTNVDATAWHNLVGRYDGTNVQLFCNDRLMASAPLTGNLIQNTEPTLIGAETDNGSIVRRFTGYIEEAALWNTALNGGQLAYLNNLTATNDAYPTQLLHYRYPDHDVGDVHVRYINGSWSLTYMYLVGTDFFQAELTTLDFLHWIWRNPIHASVSYPDVLPTWFAIESFWDPYLSKWRSVWGYAGMRSSLSDDRFNWYAPSPQTLLADPGSYRRFSDPSITQVGTNAWQMVMTMAKTNLAWETGGSIGYATSSNLTQWNFRGDLFFPGNRGVPECPTLFPMGNKWYLLSSWYAGGVGRPTYQVADSPTGPWSEFTPNSLDGKDVSAATSEAYGTNRILSGWIPLYAWNTSGQHWGGHLCFPREISQLTNGALRSRLPVDFGNKIRGSQLFPGLVNPSTKSGNWVYQNLGAQMDCYSGSGQSRTILPGLFDRFEADMTFTPATGTKRVGWLGGWQEAGGFFEVGLNQTSQTIFIRIADGIIYADLSVPVTLNASHRLRVIVEEDMVEVVYDDQFTLAARIPTKLRTTSLGLFAEGGPVNFGSVAVNRLNNLESIALPPTTVTAYEGFNYQNGSLNGKGDSSVSGDFDALGFGAWSVYSDGFHVDGSSGSPAGTPGSYAGNLANPRGSGLGSNRAGMIATNLAMASSTLTQTYGTSNGTVTLTFAMEYGYGNSFAGLELSTAGANTMFFGDGGGGTFIVSGFGGATQDTGANAKSGVRFIQCVFSSNTVVYTVFDSAGVQQGTTITRTITGFSFNTVRLYLGAGRAEGFDEITLNVSPQMTTVTSSGNNSTYGTTVSFTATVTPPAGGLPTGSMVFTIDGVPQAPVPVVAAGLNGVATISTASLPVNSGIAHTVTAQYSGSDFIDANGGPLSGGQTVIPKLLTVSGLTVSNKVYDGTTLATLGGAAVLLVPEPLGSGTSSDGRPYTGDAVILGGTPTGTFATVGLASGIPVTVTGNSISGAQAGNYTLMQQAGLSANINPIAVINVPANQPNIIAAVAAASAGYQISIATGVYTEAAEIAVNQSNVLITAAGGPVTIHVPSSASGEVSVTAVGVVFNGIKFERLTANNDWMRSVEITGAASFTNCTFTGPANGVGVILFSGADATFDNCAFSNFVSTASWAAAIFMQNQGAGYSDVIVRNCTFDIGCNGWIRAFDSNVSWARVGELTVSNCTFKASRYTTALSFKDGGSQKLTFDPAKALLFQDCTFEGTTNEVVYFAYSTNSHPTSLKFSRCGFKAYNSGSRMFYLDLATPIVFEDCLFAGGQHQTIMTVWGGPPGVNFYQCTMINEGCAGGSAQSSFINGWDGGRTFNIVNCLFRCTNNYTAGFVGDAGSSANRNYAVSYSVIDHPTPTGAKAQITPGAGYSNASLASAFVDAAGRDYHLVNGSPWVNGGVDLGYLLDLDGNARNQNGAPDMGAYELSIAPEPPTISIANNLGSVVVTFTGILQSAGQVQGTFNDVPGATSPLTVMLTSTNTFWRSRWP